MGIKLEAKDFILRDLLTMESIIIINGFRGSGKSWFVLSMANEVTWGGRLGPWKVENPVNTLVIDGEMPICLEAMESGTRGRCVVGRSLF